MSILLKNDTGRRRGNYVQYEYGEDLFGYLYLDVARIKKHRAWAVNSYLFDNERDFVLTLDIELSRRESLHYIPASSVSASIG